MLRASVRRYEEAIDHGESSCLGRAYYGMGVALRKLGDLEGAVHHQVRVGDCHVRREVVRVLRDHGREQAEVASLARDALGRLL